MYLEKIRRTYALQQSTDQGGFTGLGASGKSQGDTAPDAAGI